MIVVARVLDPLHGHVVETEGCDRISQSDLLAYTNLTQPCPKNIDMMSELRAKLSTHTCKHGRVLVSRG